MAIATINPATGETLKTYEPLSPEALEEKLARAAEAARGYRLTPVEDRAGWLRAAADVFQTLLIGSGDVEQVLRDDRVAGATLTGSAPAGQSVASIAGDALKPTVLELGGSDPFIVMPSASLEAAADVGVTARCINNG